MEERRLLLAVALSLLVLTAYRLLFPPPLSSPTPSPRPSPSAVTVATAPRAEAAPAPSVVPAVADERERRIEIQGPDLTVALTNRGARLVSWRLAHYKDERGRPEEMVESVPLGPRPLDVETGDPAVDGRLREALFRPSAETLVLPASGPAEMRLEFAEGDLAARKVLRFRPHGYLVEIQVSVRQGGRELAKKVLWGPGVGNPTAAEMEVQGYQAPQAVFLSDGGVERLPVAKIGAVRALPHVRWVGVESHYFAALLVPPPEQGAAEVRAVNLPPAEDGRLRQGPQAVLALGPGESPALLFVGPKDHQVLSALDHDLAEVVPVGEWIGPLVVPLMALLRWLNGHVGNYGWSIVVLTVLINLAMGPLRHYSIANGLKMAKLAPEMRVIQERYRKVPALDPKRQEMQKEIAELYARHGMNMSTQMAVGCLPLLLTMPFLFAIYRVLQVSIELRGASFLWIPDLSQKDPLFVTPVLMGASMLLMQRLTPSTMDPAQQRVMMIMPIVLMAMFFAAPAGLNLYWLASNACSILQQGVTLSIIRAEERPAGKEKRRR